MREIAIVNARVWTANPDRPRAEAVLLKGNTIHAVGSTRDILDLKAPNTQTIDAQHAMITPGFVDAHVHFIEGGFRLSSVQLREAATPEQFVERIQRFADSLDTCDWITGGDWDHERWGGVLPSRSWIDDVTPHNPVWVSRQDGHMALANSRALEAANITELTPDIIGGTLERDEQGRLTGILKDNAMDLVSSVVPSPSRIQEDQALAAAMAHVNARGVTSVQHMGFLEQLDVFDRAKQRNELTCRIYAATELARWTELKEYITYHGRGDTWFGRGCLKGFLDGSLGSHTAAFFEPYTDAPSDRGLFVNDPEQLSRWINDADKAGFHITTHAIGDRAIHTLLNIYEHAIRLNGPRDRRFKVEHVQHLDPNDLRRFAELDVIASMQPYHAIDDGRWAERVVGTERIERMYAFRSLIDANARVVFGSDWFVAPPTPLEGIYAAVTRRTLDGQHPRGWIPEQKISVQEALNAYTIHASFASFEESIKGSIEPGKLADMVVLEKDITEIPPDQIKDTNVLMTIVDGHIVYTHQGYSM